MKTKFLLACAVLACMFTLSSCEKNKDNVTNDTVLKGTTWGGRVNWTDVEAVFSTNTECSINLRGYADGAGKGTYVVDGNKVDVTIVSITGDFDGCAKVGDVFNCTFDLNANEMHLPLMGKDVILVRRNQ